MKVHYGSWSLAKNPQRRKQERLSMEQTTCKSYLSDMTQADVPTRRLPYRHQTLYWWSKALDDSRQYLRVRTWPALRYVEVASCRLTETLCGRFAVYSYIFQGKPKNTSIWNEAMIIEKIWRVVLLHKVARTAGHSRRSVKIKTFWWLPDPL